MSRISIVIFLIALLSTVKAFSGQKNCFVEHLKEAIEVNQQRTSIYSRASDGESYWLSRHLIHFEKLILPLAKVYDRRARVYQRAGIALFCRDFVSMEGIPTIDHIPSQIPDTPIIRPKTQAAQTKKLIYKTLRKKGIAAVTELLRIKVKQLSQQPEYYCLGRHFLESALRAALLAPEYQKQAQAAGLKDPTKLISKFIKLQLRALVWAHGMDLKALPLQQKGIPIFCSDVPEVLPL